MPLYPYQEEGARWLAQRPGALIADEPGLGKTLQIVRGADYAGLQKLLISCPAVVKEHWAREFEKWQEVRRSVEVVEGRVKNRPKGDVVIVSHAAMADMNSVKWLVNRGPWDGTATDEAHEFRTITSQRTMNVFGDQPWSLFKYARYNWAVTGTPYVNSAADFYVYVNSIFPELRGRFTWWDFCEKFTYPKDDGFGKTKPTGVRFEEELKAMLQPYMLRRTLAEVGLSLPPLRIATTPLSISDRDLKPILAMIHGWSPEDIAAMAERLEDEIDTESEAVARVRRALGLGKVNAAIEYLANLLRGGAGPIVAFFYHREVREQIWEALRHHFKVSWIDGSVNSEDQRNAAIDWFQSGRLDLLLVQTQSGGAGITLTRSNRVIVVEPPWTWMALEQIIKRVHRISQTQPVLAEVLFASGCWLEEVIAKVIAKKAEGAKKVMG